MFPLNGMRSQLKERLCLFLIRKKTANFVHVGRALDVMGRPKYRRLTEIISKSVPGYF